MNLLDLHAFHECLHTGAHLAGGSDVIRAVNGQDGITVVIVEDVRAEHALVRPRVAELDLLVNDAVSLVLLGKLIDVFAAADHLGHVHVARALGTVHVLSADLGQRVLVVRQRDRVAARERTVAEAVGTDIGAGLLDELNEVNIIDLGADDDHTRAVRIFLVRTAGLELLERLLELVDEQILRRDIGRECDDVELIARNARVGPLAVLADGADELAHAVVLGDGLADGRVRDVDAIDIVQRREDMVAALEHVQIQAVVVRLHRDLHVLKEELRLVLAHGLEQFHVLHGAVHHRAAVRRDHAVGKVVAALNGALKQRAAVRRDRLPRQAGIPHAGRTAGCSVTCSTRPPPESVHAIPWRFQSVT